MPRSSSEWHRWCVRGMEDKAPPPPPPPPPPCADPPTARSTAIACADPPTTRIRRRHLPRMPRDAPVRVRSAALSFARCLMIAYIFNV